MRRIGNSRLHGLDVLDLFTGGAESHGICNEEEPWVNGATGDIPNVVVPPTIEGYEQEAFRPRDAFGPVAP